MDVLNDIYTAIAAEGFTAGTLQMIDNYANDIQNGRCYSMVERLKESGGAVFIQAATSRQEL